MCKFGEFSRLCQVPAATLRFYDEVGLLKPERVDACTGSRSYGPDQLSLCWLPPASEHSRKPDAPCGHDR